MRDIVLPRKEGRNDVAKSRKSEKDTMTFAALAKRPDLLIAEPSSLSYINNSTDFHRCLRMSNTGLFCPKGLVKAIPVNMLIPP